MSTSIEAMVHMRQEVLVVLDAKSVFIWVVT